MKVTIPACLFNLDDPKAQTSLRRLMQRAAFGQHQIEVDGDPRLALGGSFFREAVPAAEAVMWRELLVRVCGAGAFAPPSPPPTAKIVAHPASDTVDNAPAAFGEVRLSVFDAGRWAELALEVLLENPDDAVLIALCAKLQMADGNHTLSDALTEEWLAPRGCGGGGEVGRAICDDQTQRRQFVVVDSDRTTWDQDLPDKSSAARIASKCDDAGVPCHILVGQELENYLPKSAWDSLDRRQARSGQPARAAKERQLWGHLLRHLNREIETYRRQCSHEAVDRVATRLQKSANSSVTTASQGSLWQEYCALPAQQAAVDDLKARFTERVTQRIVRAFRDDLPNVTAAGLRDEKRGCNELLLTDLAKLTRHLQEWL